jgi:ribosomal protein L19E
MAGTRDGVRKLIERETVKQKSERVAHEERKAHAARTAELLRARYGIAEDE